MTLSKRQREVINLMGKGWELGESMTFNGSSWIQKGGCGKGGESKTIHWNTIGALLDRELILQNTERFPLRTYKLTDKAKGL